MEIKELYEKIRSASFAMRKGISNSNNHGPFREQMKNVLFNNLDDIESALKFASECSKKIEVLELELDDAERELDELTKKTTPKSKKKSVDSNE